MSNSNNRKIVYPYIPNSVPEIKSQMLKEINVKNIMDLYEEIPEDLKYKGKMNLPEPILDEYSLKKHVETILKKNKNCNDSISFLGGGCSQHFVPAVCDEINGRGEFLTAYVGESYSDHGKWQAFFEYCSLMAELLDMDILSAPLYDGAQAAATSIRMASRINNRKNVILPITINPEIKLMIENYVQHDLSISYVDFDKSTGQIDLNDLKNKISNKTSSIFIENPSYLGFFESQVEEIAKIALDHGSEFITYVDPISLGVISPPSQYGSTITCGDAQTLGIHMNGGGGQIGFIATNDNMKYTSEFKDLMFGITDTNEKDEYGFSHILFERTSYGSREQGKEYTGTSQGLWAITAGVYLSLLGPQGIKEVGQTIMQISKYAAKRFSQIKNVEIKFNSPFFKEFVINFDKTGKKADEILNALVKKNIFLGINISKQFPELNESILCCVTELRTKEEIDTTAKIIEELI